MSYTREQVKAITDKVLNMAKADAVEVRFAGGERSATRYANSTITANSKAAHRGFLTTAMRSRQEGLAFRSKGSIGVGGSRRESARSPTAPSALTDPGLVLVRGRIDRAPGDERVER